MGREGTLPPSKGALMIELWITLAVLGGLILAVLGISLYCFFRVFYSPSRTPIGPDEFPIPDGEIYEAHREGMIRWMKEARALPSIPVSVKSYDGLTLRAKLYEHHEGAPIEIMMHGYRGCAERDMCGGVQRAFAVGRSALVIDHRGSGESDGHIVTFGVKERRDALSWVNFILENYGSDRKIILTGISMGAATAMMATALDLPENVIGVLADCGYTSPKAIIEKVVRDMGLPPRLVYPFIRLGAILWGGFDPNSASPIEAMKKCRIPVIFYHGDVDDFVPHSMSVENYEACQAKKRLVTIEGAGHGLAYPTNKELYLESLAEFFPEYTVK